MERKQNVSLLCINRFEDEDKIKITIEVPVYPTYDVLKSLVVGVFDLVLKG